MAYALSDVPGKGKNADVWLCRRMIYSGYPGPMVPDCGAYAIRPTLTVDCMGSFCQLPDLDTSPDVPEKGTNAVFGLC